MQGMLFLILTIVAESIAITFMKLSDGQTNKMMFGLAALFYILSFFLLTNALKHLPMGWTNAVWAGSSAVIVVLIGYFFFDENISFWMLLFIGFIVVGLVGLNLVEK